MSLSNEHVQVVLSLMSNPNLFGSDKMPKWLDNVRMLNIISNTSSCSLAINIRTYVHIAYTSSGYFLKHKRFVVFVVLVVW